MTSILFVTVGGSPDPIVTSINALRPDRIVFICSSGKHGSQSKLEEIITQCNLKDKFDPKQDLVTIDDPDRLFEVYKEIVHKVQEISTGDFLADCTGGTKTMSSALTLAALDLGMKMFVTTKDRDNTYKVEQGQKVKKVAVASLVVKRAVTQSLPPLIAQYNYSAICTQLEKLYTDFELSSDDNKYVENLFDFYKGLDLWDKFDHDGAYEYLKRFISRDEAKFLVLYLKQVIGSRVTFNENFRSENGTKAHGYEIVEDLILNAERRATMGRYDDAVGRLYRSLELLVQIRLKEKYDTKTGALDHSKLPEKIRSKYIGMTKIGLLQSYDLLVDLEDKPLGELFNQQREPIKHRLEIRNFSIMAHGLNPITQNDYKDLTGIFLPFLKEGIEQIISPKKSKSVQFPVNLINL